MTISKPLALTIGMFLIPMVCCFIGIGAFIHVTLAAEKVERLKDAEMKRQKLQDLAELQRQMAVLQNAAKDLQQKIDEVQKRILELTKRLIQLSQNSETAQVLNEETRGLKELLAKLLVELSELREQIAQKQNEIDALKDETKDAGPLDEQLKKLQKEMEELEKQRNKAKSKNSGLLQKLDELRRWREAEEDKYEIRPAKERPENAPDPVFVECTAHGVIIQPEGTRLSHDPVAGDRSRFLAAAKKTGYVVFLVRPNGFGGTSTRIGSFERYRGLLHTHNRSPNREIKFGFEPIEASWNLVYPGQEN